LAREAHTLDCAAAEAAALAVEHRKLSRRRRALRLLEVDARTAVVRELHAGGLKQLPMAQAHQGVEARAR